MKVSGYLKTGISAPGVILRRGVRYVGELIGAVVKVEATYNGKVKAVLVPVSEFKVLEEGVPVTAKAGPTPTAPASNPEAKATRKAA